MNRPDPFLCPPDDDGPSLLASPMLWGLGLGLWTLVVIFGALLA